MAKRSQTENRYKALIENIFFDRWSGGDASFEFERAAIEQVAKRLDINLPKNIGDVIYSFRHRSALPEKILATQPVGREWVIEGAGIARYRFKLVTATRIRLNEALLAINIPDATPELIQSYALDDEQALLAIIRYNRLIDTFLGLTTYSLQNHLRTTVDTIGQIEIDELYVGLDKYGCHYIIPVQAKGGRDQMGVVQISQDMAFAAQNFPSLRCRPVAAQFMSGGAVAMFELAVKDDDVKIVEERHYRLVPASDIDQAAIRNYR
jgi:hypothetical protein